MLVVQQLFFAIFDLIGLMSGCRKIIYNNIKVAINFSTTIIF